MPHSLSRRATNALRMFRPSEMAMTRQQCPLCGGRWLLRLQLSEHGVRCIGCTGNPVQMSLAAAIKRHIPALADNHVYELSSRGPFYNFLLRGAGRITVSEYYDDVDPGGWQGDVQCQDVQKLTYQSNSFDMCTSLDVFEHVADDRAGFAELERVLRPGGMLFLTVPLSGNEQTVERVRVSGDELEHILPPEYHGDHLRGASQVLCWRDYGNDILDRLRLAGFERAWFDSVSQQHYFSYGRSVVAARKAE